MNLTAAISRAVHSAAVLEAAAAYCGRRNNSHALKATCKLVNALRGTERLRRGERALAIAVLEKQASRRQINDPLKQSAIFRQMRANAVRRDALVEAFERCCYRTSSSRWAGGETSVAVRVGHPSASGEAVRVWSDNGNWSGSNSAFAFSIPADWRQRIAAAGLAVVGGRLVLDVDAGVATWVEQSRGFSLRVERGTLDALRKLG